VSEKRGFWMVICGEFVVKTWWDAWCFCGANLFHFFEIYFWGSVVQKKGNSRFLPLRLRSWVRNDKQKEEQRQRQPTLCDETAKDGPPGHFFEIYFLATAS
jgi:hypothetical protein